MKTKHKRGVNEAEREVGQTKKEVVRLIEDREETNEGMNK